MIGIKAVNVTCNMENLHLQLATLRMSSYPSTSLGARPLPVAKRGEIFSEAEKRQVDKAWREKYNIN